MLVKFCFTSIYGTASSPVFTILLHRLASGDALIEYLTGPAGKTFPHAVLEGSAS
jgi:hypothetical protein